MDQIVHISAIRAMVILKKPRVTMKKSIMVEQMFKRLLSYYFVNVSKITNGICVNTISNTNFV